MNPKRCYAMIANIADVPRLPSWESCANWVGKGRSAAKGRALKLGSLGRMGEARGGDDEGLQMSKGEENPSEQLGRFELGWSPQPRRSCSQGTSLALQATPHTVHLSHGLPSWPWRSSGGLQLAMREGGWATAWHPASAALPRPVCARSTCRVGAQPLRGCTEGRSGGGRVQGAMQSSSRAGPCGHRPRFPAAWSPRCARAWVARR